MTRYESLQQSIETSQTKSRNFGAAFAVALCITIAVGVSILLFKLRELSFLMPVMGLITFVWAAKFLLERKECKYLRLQQNMVPVLYSLTMCNLRAVVTKQVFEDARKKRPQANTIVCSDYLIYTNAVGIPRTGSSADFISLDNGDYVIKYRGDLFVPFASEGLASMDWQRSNCRVVPPSKVQEYINRR